MDRSSPNPLKHELRRRAGRVLRSELARRMGYRRVNEKLIARIDTVLTDELLGLDSGGFDFRYTDKQFLDALCNALDIDPVLRDAERERIEKIIHTRHWAFQPYVFVDTGFRRTTQPIFVMAFMEGGRHLRFEPSFLDLALHEQVVQARQRVRDHYQETGGELPFWGTVQRYLFHYGEGTVLTLDTRGHIMGETDRVHAGRARLSAGGTDITKTIRDMESDAD